MPPVRAAGAVFLLTACAAPPPAVDLQWRREPGSLSLLRDGELLWTFQHDAARPKPCFHPLALPGAGTMTLDRPGDHLWHHGLWFSWKYIDGVNYWENDGRTGRPAGRTTWTVAAIDPRDDGSCRIDLELDYTPPDGSPVLHERRVLTVAAPAADGSYAIDHHGVFTAQRACVLDRTPMPGEPKGQANGGYAGLALRLANLGAREAAATTGPAEWNQHDRTRPTASAFDYHGRLGEREVGVALLAHPGNPAAPGPWYAVRNAEMTFCNAAVLAPAPRRLAANESFTLRYRVVVHPGRWDAARLAAAVADYVATVGD